MYERNHDGTMRSTAAASRHQHASPFTNGLEFTLMNLSIPDTASLIFTFSYVSHLRCATTLDDDSKTTICVEALVTGLVCPL
jgi:hypothetical protein